MRVHAGPAAGDAADAGGPGGGGGGGEGLGACHVVAGTVEPVVGAVVRVDALGGQAVHRSQVGAVLEHALIAAGDKRGGKQLGGGGEACSLEHTLVAALGQRGGGQHVGRYGGEGGAAVKHIIIAAFSQ